MSQTPQEIFNENNNELALNLRKLIHKTVSKANDLIDDCETPNDLLTAAKIAEVAGKMTGIVQEKQQINMQINNISGFTFIEVDKEAVIQQYEADKQLIES